VDPLTLTLNRDRMKMKGHDGRRQETLAATATEIAQQAKIYNMQISRKLRCKNA